MKTLIQSAFDSLPDTPFPSIYTPQWFIDVRWAAAADACQEFIERHLNEIEERRQGEIEYDLFIKKLCSFNLIKQ